jgi:nucleoside-diphosphate-sugar epimerase
MAATLLALGHGYTAAALTPGLLAEGWRVFATHREPDGAAGLRRLGLEPVAWTAPALRAALAEADHVLVSVPPDAAGEPTLALLAADLARAEHLRWVGYLSTTAVYGDHAGAWVDERTPPAPSSARGRARLAAEDAWLGLWREAGLPVEVFRLAGIYGPGRGPLAKLLAGRAQRVHKPGQVFGRIHVEDLAAVLRAAMARPRPGRLLNVTDDEPAPAEVVLAHAAALAGLPVPPLVPFEAAAMTAMARSFYGEAKRVGNARLKAELGIGLRYPSYREGLARLAGQDPALAPALALDLALDLASAA